MLKDCSKAIALNPHSAKAHYRSAMALVALERFDEALDCCDRCLQFDADNKGVQGVRARTLDRKAAIEKKEQTRLERIRKEQEAEMKLKIAYRVRVPSIPFRNSQAT